MSAPSILAPVDFSDASRGALRHAAVLAEHFGAGLVVMTATDPLLAEAAAMGTSAEHVTEETLEALRAFVRETLDRPLKGVSVTYEAPTGKPHDEILRAARAHRSDLLVISSHGLTGFRRMFFGSTTERVLRETAVPVLVVPGHKRGPDSLAEAIASVRRILVPVLLPAADGAQLAIVRGLSDVLNAPALVLHVVEPARAALPRSERYLPGVERERRARAEADLEQVMQEFAGRRAEALLAYGEPAEEIVKVADDRDAGLIVMSLTGSALAGPRIGSVTYRVLCAAGRLVLALPPGLSAEAPRAKAGIFSQGAKKATAAGSRVKVQK